LKINREIQDNPQEIILEIIFSMRNDYHAEKIFIYFKMYEPCISDSLDNMDIIRDLCNNKCMDHPKNRCDKQCKNNCVVTDFYRVNYCCDNTPTKCAPDCKKECCVILTYDNCSFTSVIMPVTGLHPTHSGCIGSVEFKMRRKIKLLHYNGNLLVVLWLQAVFHI